MDLIDKTTGKIIASVLTNHSMTLNELIEAVGGEIINNTNDPRWSDDGDNVIIYGIRYWYEDLE